MIHYTNISFYILDTTSRYQQAEVTSLTNQRTETKLLVNVSCVDVGPSIIKHFDFSLRGTVFIRNILDAVNI
jgi:hypothetical protein